MQLLTDELSRRVGETRSYTALEPLSRASIRYYALAVGDHNPVYTDAAAAQAAGLPDVMAPPTLLCDSNQYLSGARDEEGFAGHSWGISTPGTRLVRGGNDYTFYRAAHPDDVVTVTWRLASISERISSAGRPMLVIMSEATVADARGELILQNVETLIISALPEETA